MQQDQALVQHPAHGLLRFPPWRRIVALQDRFGELDVPVADLAPCEGVKRVGGVVEAVGFQGGVDVFADLAVSPMIHLLSVCVASGSVRPGVRDLVMFGKAEGVPELGAEVAVALDAVFEILSTPPSAAIAALVKRSASAPYSSIISSGSMTLPVDLDIFLPLASRTSWCR